MNLQPLVPATLRDTQRIAAELFPWEREHQTALAVAASAFDHLGFLKAHRLVSVQCWTAHVGSGPVFGLGALYRYAAQPEEVWLAWFGLIPSARGCGRGAYLLDWLIGTARAERRHTLRLWTTDEPEYAKAAELYRRRGFVAEDHPAAPGEHWRTWVFSLGLDGHVPIAWSSVLGRGELCGREAPVVTAAAA